MGDKNKNAGNDYFLSPNKGFDASVINKKIVRTEQNGFGGLGDGILRPKSSQFSTPPISIDNNRRYLFKPMGALSEKEKTDQLSKQIADSIQARIDAAAKNDVNSTNLEQAATDKKGMPVGIIITISVSAILALWMIAAVANQMKKVTPKKVIQ